MLSWWRWQWLRQRGFLMRAAFFQLQVLLVNAQHIVLAQSGLETQGT